MREQEEEEARRRQAAAEQAQEEMALSGLDSRGGVWSSKFGATTVPLKEIMMQQQETSAISTGTPKSSDNKQAQDASRVSSQPQQTLSLKEIQAEQLRAAEQEKQARAQQKAAAATPVVVHVPVAVIASKDAHNETPKAPTSKGKQADSPKASTAGVWGAPAAAPSLKEIQAEQLRQAELQKEQLRAQQLVQRAAASPSFANVAASGVVPQAMSLKEIQAEELRSKQSTQRTAASAPESLSPAAIVSSAAPSLAPLAPAKSSATSTSLSASKKLQGSAAPSSSAPVPAPASAPPVAASAVQDDDDIVWDYSSKPAAKTTSRQVSIVRDFFVFLIFKSHHLHSLNML